MVSNKDIELKNKERLKPDPKVVKKILTDPNWKDRHRGMIEVFDMLNVSLPCPPSILQLLTSTLHLCHVYISIRCHDDEEHNVNLEDMFTYISKNFDEIADIGEKIVKGVRENAKLPNPINASFLKDLYTDGKGDPRENN